VPGATDVLAGDVWVVERVCGHSVGRVSVPVWTMRTCRELGS